jgi:predicted ATPase
VICWRGELDQSKAFSRGLLERRSRKKDLLKVLAIANYRSLRSVVLPLASLNVITGENGSGKSSMYRALRLLADTAQGSVIASLAREGGLQSTLWAGPEKVTRGMRRGEVAVQGGPRTEPVNLRLGFSSDDLNYCIDLGLPIVGSSAFGLDPEIKRECIWSGPTFRPASLLVDRRGAVVRVRGDDSQWRVVTSTMPTFDSMLAQLADPRNAPEVLAVREQIRSWRFYDHFRTDVDSPVRQAQLGTRTPALSHDGRDLAAALQTIIEIGNREQLAEAIADAFVGSTLEIDFSEGRFAVFLRQPGLLRPLSAAELSDGTLRYLLLIAALLTPRPPPLMVLNEPETSLHPDLLPALARLITAAAERSQVWVVSHSGRLLAALQEAPACNTVRLTKELGTTQIDGQGLLDQPAWQWPPR